MRFLKYIFCALLFVTASVADTININWINDGTTYAQTTCTVGGDIILPTPPTKRGYTFAGWNARKVYSDGLTLPFIYNRLEFITIQRGGYLILDTTNTENTKWLADFMYTGTTTPSVPWLGGFRNSNNTNRQLLQLYIGNSSALLYFQYADISGESHVDLKQYGGISNKRHIYGFQGNQVLLNGTVVYKYPEVDPFIGSPPLYIGTASSSSSTKILEGNLYSVKVWQNGVKQDINAVPVQRLSDGVVGMFDTIRGDFYSNAGTGEFIAGPVIYEE